MDSLNAFEAEMEADGQGSYSLFPTLDNIASLSGTAETLERLVKTKIFRKTNVLSDYYYYIKHTNC